MSLMLYIYILRNHISNQLTILILFNIGIIRMDRPLPLSTNLPLDPRMCALIKYKL